MSLCLLFITMAVVKLNNAETTVKPNNEKPAVETIVNFEDGVEMEMKKVNDDDGKKISVMTRSEIKSDDGNGTDNKVYPEPDLKDYHLEKLKDIDGNEVEVLVKEDKV